MEVNAEKYTCMFNFLEQNGGQNQKIKVGNRLKYRRANFEICRLPCTNG